MAEEHLLKIMLSTTPAFAGTNVMAATVAIGTRQGNRNIDLNGLLASWQGWLSDVSMSLVIHTHLLQARDVGLENLKRLYSFISLRQRVAATTRQLTTTISPMDIHYYPSQFLSWGNPLPVSNETDLPMGANGM